MLPEWRAGCVRTRRNFPVSVHDAMNLASFLAELDELLAEAQMAFNLAADPAALEAARIEYVGAAKGRLKAVQKGLGQVAKDDKPAAGKRFNEVKSTIEAAFEAAQQRASAASAARQAGPQIDLTLPGKPLSTLR